MQEAVISETAQSPEPEIPVMQKYRPLLFILIALALVYFPFVNKAFTVDDTLFLKAADQIMETPLDFYGGEVNWYWITDKLHAINKNPPLVSYLIAGVASVFGFNEIALHTFFFLPLALSAIGIYLLGLQFRTNPVFTTAIAIFTPVFMVHGTNVMTDSTMLMFWIWGLVFWRLGTESGALKWFLFGGLSIALGVLTKYTCILLLPLLIFSGVWKFRKPGRWLVTVAIPLILLFAFEYYTYVMYGKGLFLDAFSYAGQRSPKEVIDYLDNTLIGLAFLGGCFPVGLLLMPAVGGWLLRSVMLVIGVAGFTLILTRGMVGDHQLTNEGANLTSLIFQFSILVLAGICLVTACLKEVSRKLDHDRVFLLLWFFGILVFVFYLNWTINARSFILMAPAIGILLSRRLEEWGIREEGFKRIFSRGAVVMSALVAVSVVHADYTWANTARAAAKEIVSRYGSAGKLWFQGHWGFQFYMEKMGASPVDFSKNEIQPGEHVAIPLNNTNLAQMGHQYGVVEVLHFKQHALMASMSRERQAGFYASVWGVVPYVLGSPGVERYMILRKNR